MTSATEEEQHRLRPATELPPEIPFSMGDVKARSHRRGRRNENTEAGIHRRVQGTCGQASQRGNDSRCCGQGCHAGADGTLPAPHGERHPCAAQAALQGDDGLEAQLGHAAIAMYQAKISWPQHSAPLRPFHLKFVPLQRPLHVLAYQR